MQIHPVENREELKQFIDLPYQLYKSDPVWVPPLRSEQWSQFDAKRNPMLDHCTYKLFVVRDNGQVIGRISAFTDRLALEHWKEPIGLFGSYECIDNKEVSRMLLETARDWLRQQGMKAMRGPWSFASQEWGLVVEGYTPPPVILAPYNPPCYNDHLVAFGLQKAKDLRVYEMDYNEGYRFPERYLVFTDKIRKRYEVTIRPVNMKRLEEDVLTIVDLANHTINDNWGFYPVTPDEGRAMARDLKDIINPRAVLLAEDSKGKAIGFAMSLPDVNVLLKKMNGSLLPFGWIRLLWGLPRLRQYRMWALGVLPEYHGKGIDTLLYRTTYENLFYGKVRMEVNYVLEDNTRMNNALVKLGVKPLRRYRVYQMDI